MDRCPGRELHSPRALRVLRHGDSPKKRVDLRSTFHRCVPGQRHTFYHRRWCGAVQKGRGPGLRHAVLLALREVLLEARSPKVLLHYRWKRSASLCYQSLEGCSSLFSARRHRRQAENLEEHSPLGRVQALH